MEYGYFDNKNREYVITRPDTPLPWINYLGADEYCALCSNTAGGYSFYQDARLQRLTRYRYNNIPLDNGGRYIYIRDNGSADYWSATWQPVRKNTSELEYECRHGLGYTKIKSIYNKIKTETTYLVPMKENCEIWCCELENLDNIDRSLSIFSLVEFCLYDALNDMTDFQYNLNIARTEWEPTTNTIYHTTGYDHAVGIFTYFSVNTKTKGFDSERFKFFGPYGSFADPQGVKDNVSNNSLAIGWNPIGSHRIEVELKAGEKKTLIFTLGVAKKRGEEKELIGKYKSSKDIEQAIAKIKTYWENNLSKYQAQTPDEDINTMVNIWNQYQCRTTFNWSRSASFWESGIGRGMGFRDSCQDILGFVHMIPAEAKQRIIDIASTQFHAGNACHQYQPLTKKGAGGGFSDDHLWLIIAVAAYLKETGDFGFLEESIPYNNGEEGSGPLWDHLCKAIDFTRENCGPHGLPLMFNADWNDCLNLFGPQEKSETVWVGIQYIYVCKEMIEMAKHSKHEEMAPHFGKLAEEMSKIVNTHGWDGEWYRRAYTEKGEPVGSNTNKEGKIFLLPQAWSVMADIAPKDRLTQAMNSLNKLMATEHGIVLLQPGYTKYSGDIGWITAFPPGLKENGAIFCHPNPWAMIAETILGNGQRAMQYYKAILPAAKNKIADLRKTEPYVYCQMIAGKEHPDFGEGKNSWLTGTAAWNLYAGTSYILGIRAAYNGLCVDPCVPASWSGFEVTRVYRGGTYKIKITNPNGKEKGIASMLVNDKTVTGNIVPLAKAGETIIVEAVLG